MKTITGSLALKLHWFLRDEPDSAMENIAHAIKNSPEPLQRALYKRIRRYIRVNKRTPVELERLILDLHLLAQEISSEHNHLLSKSELLEQQIVRYVRFATSIEESIPLGEGAASGKMGFHRWWSSLSYSTKELLRFPLTLITGPWVPLGIERDLISIEPSMRSDIRSMLEQADRAQLDSDTYTRLQTIVNKRIATRKIIDLINYSLAVAWLIYTFRNFCHYLPSYEFDFCQMRFSREQETLATMAYEIWKEDEKFLSGHNIDDGSKRALKKRENFRETSLYRLKEILKPYLREGDLEYNAP